MELETIQMPWPFINCDNLTICKVCLDVVALNKFWPVAVILDEYQGKNSLLPQLYYFFQDTEPTIKYNKLGSVPQWFRLLQEWTNSFPLVRKFFWWTLT